MSQVLTAQYSTSNDVVNNNQPEWNKVPPMSVALGADNSGEVGNVYTGRDDTSDRLTGNCTLRSAQKHGESRFSNIQDGLESSISAEGKERVRKILNDVSQLSDVEKLLLYLKLPTGSTPEEGLRQTPTSFLHSSNRVEQAQAFTWIRSHLEEDNEICVPKCEVFEDYRLYCESHALKPLCQADFGKVMKCVFPNVKPRRLGQRGQSKYCYSGLRKKLEVQPPSLPELEILPKREKEEKSEEEEVNLASRQLICEWAHKLLGGNFTNLRELAEYLLGNLYVNSKSTAAFTVLAAMQDAGFHNSKVPVSSLFTCSSGGNKHKETQLQLQRKLQERELIKEQKRKLQQQRSENERENEQFRSQTNSVSPSPFQSPIKSAARNITKLLTSPVSGDPNLKGSPQLLQQMMKGSRSVERKASTEVADIMCNGHAPVKMDSILRSRSGSSGRQSENGQYHIVKKPSVRPANQTSQDKPAQGEAVQVMLEADEKASKTCDSSTENGHFALPTTPSRSAFVPVSNQWKDVAVNQTVSEESLMSGDEDDKKTSSMDDSSDNILDISNEDIKSDSGMMVSPNGVSNDISSSPVTPKKSRNRFPPIRPKVPVSKTVSSILKDHKTPNGDGPAYDSRPVAAILKERRAREAQEILAQLTTGVTLQGGHIQQGLGLPGTVTAVSSDILQLPLQTGNSQSNEVFIIVGSPKPGSTGLNGQAVSLAQNGLDMATNSQFPPNVTAPMTSSSVPLAVLLAKHEEAQKQQQQRAMDSASAETSDMSDNGNLTDDMAKPEQESVTMRDTDTPSGRKRKSSDRDVESKTKRMNSSDSRMEEDEVFLPQMESPKIVPRTSDMQSLKRVNKQGEKNNHGNKLSLESLESDALLDSGPIPMDHDLVSSMNKPSPPSTQTASIGVSAKSMRSTQKQLLQQKPELDQRVNKFFNKGSRNIKDGSTESQLMSVDPARIEEVLQQYVKQHNKSVKSSTNVPAVKSVPNSHPVNLLSLLQRPVFESKKVVVSSVSKVKKETRNTEPVVCKAETLGSNSGVKNDTSKVFLTLSEPTSDVQLISNMTTNIQDSDLPSDVADFITEIMTAQENSVHELPNRDQMLGNLGSHSLQSSSLEDPNNMDYICKNAKNSSEPFTVPSTPPPPRQKPETTAVKQRFVQRSVSLPVFVPPQSLGQTQLMTLGKGLDMPAPPNRVIEGPSPHQIPSGNTACHLGRQRRTSVGSHTSLSDAGYHSFDASPVMNSTPGLPGSVLNNSNTSIASNISDSADTSDQFKAQSPISLSSPKNPSCRSTPSSLMSPVMAGPPSISSSPSESVSSPNSFMPIQGGRLSTRSSPRSSPQVVTPVKPLVTMAASPSNTVILDSRATATLVSVDSNEKLLQNASCEKKAQDSNTKIGVLQKLLNSKCLPSYEEAVTQLSRVLPDDNPKENNSTLTVTNLQTVSEKTKVTATVSRSISSSEVELKTKLKNPLLSEKLSQPPVGSDNSTFSTSDYPFSYQLALLKEKCLKPVKVESRQESSKTGKSVQRKSAKSKPKSSEIKALPSDMDCEIEGEGNSVHPDTAGSVSGQSGASNVTHHYYGNATQKPSSHSVVSQSFHTSGASARSKSSSTIVIRSSTNSVAQSRVNSVPCDSSNTVSSVGSKPRLSATSFTTTDLPNVNYMGDAPNIDLGSILQGKQNEGSSAGGESSGGDRSSRLTLMQALQPTQTINEEELQSTLEILRSLDSQYFSQLDWEIDTMQPSVQHQPSTSSQSSPQNSVPQSSPKSYQVSPLPSPQPAAHLSSHNNIQSHNTRHRHLVSQNSPHSSQSQPSPNSYTKSTSSSSTPQAPTALQQLLQQPISKTSPRLTQHIQQFLSQQTLTSAPNILVSRSLPLSASQSISRPIPSQTTSINLLSTSHSATVQNQAKHASSPQHAHPFSPNPSPSGAETNPSESPRSNDSLDAQDQRTTKRLWSFPHNISSR